MAAGCARHDASWRRLLKAVDEGASTFGTAAGCGHVAVAVERQAELESLEATDHRAEVVPTDRPAVDHDARAAPVTAWSTTPIAERQHVDEPFARREPAPARQADDVARRRVLCRCGATATYAARAMSAPQSMYEYYRQHPERAAGAAPPWTASTFVERVRAGEEWRFALRELLDDLRFAREVHGAAGVVALIERPPDALAPTIDALVAARRRACGRARGRQATGVGRGRRTLPGAVVVPPTAGLRRHRVQGCASRLPSARHLPPPVGAGARVSTGALLDRDRILAALGELGRRLEARGVLGDLYVVGGAAIALAYDARRVTRDVDALFEPKLVIYDLARQVAADLALPAGWLNDAVEGFLLGPDPGARVLELPGLRVQLASPLMLLAMKVYAARVGEDEADVRALAQLCGFVSARAILDACPVVPGCPDTSTARPSRCPPEVARPRHAALGRAADLSASCGGSVRRRSAQRPEGSQRRDPGRLPG